MDGWYDNGIGSEKLKRDIAKSAKEDPVTFPCLDPEGCKHFKAEQNLEAEIATLKEEQAKLYRAAYEDGIMEYAWWKDGVQYVGTCGKTLEEALKG